MCQQTSSHVNSNSTHDMFDHLIPQNLKTTTLPPPTLHFSPHKSHLSEATKIATLTIPIILTGILMYSRSLISMLFLGRLGDLPLAAGSLAIGFANITGYSILSGLAVGMEPICAQAFGAGNHKTLGLCLQRTVLLLLATSLPICILWVNMKQILIFCGQDQEIATMARTYLLYTLPDLLIQSFLHPLRIYLRSQSITLPLTLCATFSMLLHLPINYLLVTKLQLGIKGVALSSVFTNFNLVMMLITYLIFSGVYRKTWGGVSRECVKGWSSLLSLAVPSCVSVCLEWWWYEIMILLCGLLVNPQATVASMGILIQTTALIYIFPSSLSCGVSTRVGNELGAGRPDRAKVAAVVGLWCSYVLGFCALFFAASVRSTWAAIFTKDEKIIELTSLVLPIIGLCELGNCPQTTGCGILRGTARPRIGANINLGCFYFVGMPVAVGLGFYMGYDFEGLWLGMLVAQIACVVVMMVVVWRTDWEVEAKKAKSMCSGPLMERCDADSEEENYNLMGTANNAGESMSLGDDLV